MDHTVPVSTLLRKCLVIATKLDLGEFRKWAESELNGYFSRPEIPDYRVISGEIRTPNPVNGIWMHIVWNGGEPEWARRQPLAQKLAEIEDVIETAKREKGGRLCMGLIPPIKQYLMERVTDNLEPHSVVDASRLRGIIDAVRTAILNWSLKLEKDGILGENMSFTPEEKKKATPSGNTYNFSHSTGIFLGNVKADALQVGDFNAIYADLKRLGIPQKERNELENIVDELKTCDKQPEKKQKLLTAGVNWVMRNADKLGTLSETIRKWFEPGP